MVHFIIRRLLWTIPVLFAVAAVTFFLMHQAPGGPWDREKPISASVLKVLNQRFGLDKPYWFNPEAAEAAADEGPIAQVRAFFDSQFWNYIFGAVQGDLGPSYRERGSDVQDILLERFPYTAKVGLVAILFAVLVGLPLGIIGALKQNTIFDYVSLFVATVGISVPSFVIGLLLLIFMARVFDYGLVRRPEEWEGFSRVYILPGIILGLTTMAYVTRLMRSSMLEVKQQDYIRTARAKGLGTTKIIGRHMLRNSLIPVLSILGPAIADLVTGSFIIETIFNVPGIGRQFVESISARDYSMIMGVTLFYAVMVVVGNLLVDLSYGFLDPRIRAR